MEALADRFFQKTARIENMILLAGVLPCNKFPDSLQEFFQLESWGDIKECLGDIPDDIMEEIEDNDEAVAEWLMDQRKLGFLIQFATPFQEYNGPVATYSWGHYYTKWVYGETLDAALNEGFLWVEKSHAENKKKGEK